MSSETDPLLPKGNSAPEITGFGFSRPLTNRADLYNEAIQTYNQDPEEEEEDLPEYSAQNNEASQRQRDIASAPCHTFAGLFSVVIIIAVIITIFNPGVLDIIWDPSDWAAPWDPNTPGGLATRVSKILTSTPLIDGHNDLAGLIRATYHNNIYSKKFTSAFEKGPMASHVDLPRLKTGRVGGSFWSAYTPCLANGTDFDNATIHARSIATTLSQIDLLHRLTEAYPTKFASPLLNSTAALQAFEKSRLLISPIGIEGLHQIGASLSNLRLYHSLGVKYATLTHNCYNHYADPALLQDPFWNLTVAPPYWNGLSPAGTTLVREMNRIGMLVDLAHVSLQTMQDVLGGTPAKFPGSAAPIIFSHSSAYALCPHPRNVPDEILHLVAETNSLVMVNVAPEFISCVPAAASGGGGGGEGNGLPALYEGNATIHQVARHIVYIGRLIGFAHVGIGSDFDGIPRVPRGLEDVAEFPDLVLELLKMGVADGDVRRVVGENILRVWGDVEQVAERMQKEGVKPAEDDIETLFG